MHGLSLGKSCACPGEVVVDDGLTRVDLPTYPYYLPALGQPPSKTGETNEELSFFLSFPPPRGKLGCTSTG